MSLRNLFFSNGYMKYCNTTPFMYAQEEKLSLWLIAPNHHLEVASFNFASSVRTELIKIILKKTFFLFEKRNFLIFLFRTYCSYYKILYHDDQCSYYGNLSANFFSKLVVALSLFNTRSQYRLYNVLF